jgi:hypothetical protein
MIISDKLVGAALVAVSVEAFVCFIAWGSYDKPPAVPFWMALVFWNVVIAVGAALVWTFFKGLDLLDPPRHL